jgi:hypothetical protein
VELLERTGLLAYHRGMLADHDRVDRYREAIHAVVRPGDVVVDVGAGTGVLSYFACQAGAARVYAIEGGPIIALARELSRANGFDDRVTFVPGHSSRVTLPEPADVLITETLWNFGIGEGMMGFIDDARRRFLKPGAPVVPQRIDLYLAGVELPQLHAQLAEGPQDRHGLDFAAMRPYALNQVHIPYVDPAAFVTEPAVLTSIDLAADAPGELGAQASLQASRRGTLHGFAGWFEAQLAPGVRLGNVPPAQGSSWAHVLFPLERAVPVEPGTPVRVGVDTVGNGTTWRWRTEVNGDRLDQTTLFGFPFDPSEHLRRAPATQPVRTRPAEALAAALSRFDGSRTLEVVADELAASFPDLFADRPGALDFAREAAERYTS